MLLEVARAVAATGKRFPRTILFAWFAAEEQGLTGSWAFVKNPPVPLERIAVMINTDMVGQGKPVLRVGGAEVYPRDALWLGGPGAGEPFETKPFRSQPNSDHHPFQVSGVPAFFVVTEGPHPHYHQPGDDASNIKPELLQQAGRFVHALAGKAATLDAPFVRPHRFAEYLWHDCPVADLWSGATGTAEAGVDVSVRWLEGDAAAAFNEIERALAAHEAKTFAATMMLPGSAPQSALEELKPALLLGLRGSLAARTPRPARRLGALWFAPFLGPAPADGLGDLAELAKERPLVLDLRGAPAGVDPAALPGPLVVGPAEAERWQAVLAARKDPWLLAVRCLPADSPADAARSLLDHRARHGAAHVHAGPACSEAVGPQAPATAAPAFVQALLDSGLKPAEVRQLLGGNLLRLLEAAAK
jgi:hypothetical protein